MITISVVIPLYNKFEYIERALHSVLAQTFQDFEIIVIDDGSTDRSGDKVKIISDSRIHLIRQDNSGVSAARNLGIKEAKADLIAFLDADDEWSPLFLETILKLRKDYPDAGLYATAYDIFNYGQIQKLKLKNISFYPYEGILQNYFRSAALGEPPICSSAVSIPQKVFDEVGIFAIGEKFGEDLDMWGRIALKYPIAFSCKIGATYYQNANNRTCKTYCIKGDLPFVKTVNKTIDNIDNNQIPVDILSDIKEYIARLQIYTAKQNILAGNLENARKILSECETFCLYWQKLWCVFLTMMPGRLIYFVYQSNQIIIRTISKIRKGK